MPLRTSQPCPETVAAAGLSGRRKMPPLRRSTSVAVCLGVVVAPALALLGALLGGLLVASAGIAARAAEPADAPAAATEAQRRQERFRTLVTDATLVGRFTIDRATARAPGREETPNGAEASPPGDAATPAEKPAPELTLRDEEYTISGALPLGGDLWVITSRIRYGDKDVTVPVPVAVKWAGDTPVITLDTITIPGLGTFSSRVVLDGDRYAGTWQHDDVGGHMFGRIERRAKQ